VIFNGSSVHQWHGVALRWVFDGGSVGCDNIDLCREHRTLRHGGYGEHMRCGELWWWPAWRRAAAVTEGTAVMTSDQSGRNASAFKGARRRATG
jgi:hypothetical protein